MKGREAYSRGLRHAFADSEQRQTSGWVQSFVDDNALFLAQLFVDGQFQRRGIGTEVVKALIGEPAQIGLALALGVVKTNPALRLYERLGIRITHDDDRKFYMRRDCGG